VFFKDHFSDGLLYPECCHDFNLLSKKSDSYVKYATAEYISHHDQEMSDLQDDNLNIDAFYIVPNASILLGYQENPIIPFENLKSEEKIDKITSDNFRSAENVEGSS